MRKNKLIPAVRINEGPINNINKRSKEISSKKKKKPLEYEFVYNRMTKRIYMVNTDLSIEYL